MNYSDGIIKLNAYRKQIAEIREEMRTLQAAIEPQPVEDYTLATLSGPVQLSDLFGDKRDLFVIHNMGTSCSYCTLWADGYNGIYDHLADRAAFVVASPDSPEVQAEFAHSRGWRFPMVSHQGSSFAADLGYGKDEYWRPGLSVFAKVDGRIMRISDTDVHPGDDFCSLWHMFDMLHGGVQGWQPAYSYPKSAS